MLSPRAEVHELLWTAAKVVNKSLKKDKEEFTSKLATKADGHVKILYQTTKTFDGKYGKPEVTEKDKDGEFIFGKEVQSKQWMEHFHSLQNRPLSNNPPDFLPSRNELSINCDAKSQKKEIMEAVNMLNQGKTAGPDEIPSEALKVNLKLTAESSSYSTQRSGLVLSSPMIRKKDIL